LIKTSESFEFVDRYEVVGGMQDYNYARSNAFDITFELSCCKYPPGSTIPEQWLLNKESLIKYLEQVHIGIKGNINIILVFMLYFRKKFYAIFIFHLQVLYSVRMVDQLKEQTLL